jgi:hypothetical protein
LKFIFGKEEKSMVMTLEQNRNLSLQTSKEFGHKIGLGTRLFGCWHNKISRPFTKNHISYRVCLDCGARRHFDAKTLTTFGAFYYPPEVSSLN